MAISNNSTGIRPGVCTSTTRPTAPYEGQMIYETNTDLTYIWGGSAWQQVSGGTAVGNSGLVYITGGALSGASTNFVGCFSATYDSYIVRAVNLSSTSVPDLIGFRMLSGTSALTTSGIYYSGSSSAYSDGTTNTIQVSSNVGFIGRQLSTTTNTGCFSVEWHNPFQAKRTFWQGQSSTWSGTVHGTWNGGGSVNNTSSYDGLQILSNNGATFAGNVYIYGIRI